MASHHTMKMTMKLNRAKARTSLPNTYPHFSKHHLILVVLSAQLESSGDISPNKLVVNRPVSWCRNLMLAIALMVTCVGQADARKVSRVIIDPGHGGKDKGANRGTVYEKDLALKVAFLVEKMLKAKGMPVTMTRRSDQYISLRVFPIDFWGETTLS